MKNLTETQDNIFTIAFEIELETLDINLKNTHTKNRILLEIKLDLIDELDNDNIKYKNVYLDYLMSLVDLSNIERTSTAILEQVDTEEEIKIAEHIIDILEDNEDFEKSDEEIKSNLLYTESMVQKHLPTFYEKYSNELKFEFDSTLNKGIEFSQKTYITTISKSIEYIECFYEDFNKQIYWLMTDATSIHINIGFNKDVKWNILKGLISLNEYEKSYVPQVFKNIEHRITSNFCQSLLCKIEKTSIKSTDIKNIENDILINLYEIAHKYGIKTFSMNINNIKNYNYVEFRHIGGVVNMQTVIEKILYFTNIAYLMTHDINNDIYYEKLNSFVSKLNNSI